MLQYTVETYLLELAFAYHHNELLEAGRGWCYLIWLPPGDNLIAVRGSRHSYLILSWKLTLDFSAVASSSREGLIFALKVFLFHPHDVDNTLCSLLPRAPNEPG